MNMSHSPEIERLLAAPAPDCVELMRHGSKSFFAASRLLPARYRDAAVSLYAFCRVADDEVDGSGASPDTLAQLHARLDSIYAGTPYEVAADQAFARVVHRYRLPRRIPLALLEGFQWDAQGRRYQTFPELLDYCARVAGTVGAMMALVMEVRDERALARACELGVAMQLTNIARDVGEDARNGRLYLPLNWLAEAGLDGDAVLAAPRHSPALAAVIARLLAGADVLYARSLTGIAMLPGGCRPSIHAARLLYADIGRAVEANGHDSINARAVVSAPRKLQLLVSALSASLGRPPQSGLAALPEAQFLVDAVGRAGEAQRPPRTLDERAQWLTDLFTRLEKQRS